MWKQLIELWRSDDLLDQAYIDSFEMMSVAHEMCIEAIRVLREADNSTVNEEIRNKDKIVNKYERNVRRKVMTHCSVRGPEDLSSGMILVNIVVDIERIGDYCKNILDLASVHSKKLNAGSFETLIVDVEKEVLKRFKKTIKVLEEQDEESALSMMSTFKGKVGSVCDEIVNTIAIGNIEDLSVSEAVSLALYARYLKRISAHLNNMITTVVNPFERIGFRAK